MGNSGISTEIKDSSSEISDRKPKSTHSWTTELAREAVELASALVSKYPDAKFYGIGQSPAYIVDAIGSYSEKMGSHSKTEVVPFSGSHLVCPSGSGSKDAEIVWKLPDKDNHQLADVPILLEYLHAQENMGAYRELLKTLGLSPGEIISNYTKSGQQTVVMDNLKSGGGFASFCLLIFKWAQEEGVDQSLFSKALVPVALVAKDWGYQGKNYLKDKPTIKIPQEQIQISCDYVEVSQELRKAMNANDKFLNTRSVPSYPSKEWGNKPEIPDYSDPQVVKNIRSMIKNAVEEKIAEETPIVEDVIEPQRKINELPSGFRRLLNKVNHTLHL